MAKGTDDNPAVVIIDQSGSSNDVDANITNDSSNPIPVTVQGGAQAIVEYRVVGVTDTKTDGAIDTVDQFGSTLHGYAAMDRLCQVEVDPNARAATVSEWLAPRAFALPEGFTGVWLTPGTLTVVYRPDAVTPDRDWTVITQGQRPSIGFSGASPTEALTAATCDSYEAIIQGTAGFHGGRDGTVSNGSCNLMSAIACAALVAVPVSD